MQTILISCIVVWSILLCIRIFSFNAYSFKPVRVLAGGLIFFFLVSGLISCAPKEEIPIATIPNYTIVNIEGCEYFLYPVTHGYSSMTHKGNCSNPIHSVSSAKNVSP